MKVEKRYQGGKESFEGSPVGYHQTSSLGLGVVLMKKRLRRIER